MLTPCMVKQEQCCAFLEAQVRFPALGEGSHILIFQTDELSEEPAVQSEKGKNLQADFLKLHFCFLCFWCNDTYSSWQHINPICSRMLSILSPVWFGFFLLNLECNSACCVQHGRNPHQKMIFCRWDSEFPMSETVNCANTSQRKA